MTIQQRVLLKRHINDKEVYMGLDLFRSNIKDPYMLYIALMPWGTPIGLYWTEQQALEACAVADESKEMVKFREQNEQWHIYYRRDKCYVTALPLPMLIGGFNQYGEVIKDPQKDLLLLSEQGGIVLLRESNLEAYKEA